MPIDFADAAQEITENHLERSLRNRPQLTVPYSGSCMACGEDVTERRFCDSHCREEYEKTLKRKGFR